MFRTILARLIGRFRRRKRLRITVNFPVDTATMAAITQIISDDISREIQHSQLPSGNGVKPPSPERE